MRRFLHALALGAMGLVAWLPARSALTVTEANNHYTLRWEKPASILNTDGTVLPVNPDSLTFRIVNWYTSTPTVLVDNLRDSVWTDPADIVLTTPPYMIKYKVYAVFRHNGQNLEGAIADAKVYKMGHYEAPVNRLCNEWKNTKPLEWVYLYDNNKNGKTWVGYSTTSYTGSGSHYFYRLQATTDTKKQDDWVISMPVRLLKDRQYTIVFSCTEGTNGKKLDSMEYKIGRGRTPEDMTITLVKPRVLTKYKVNDRDTVQFEPEEDGYYYIGAHAVSAPKQGFINYDGFYVSAAVPIKAPNAPINLQATPDPTGLTDNVTLKFTTPSTNIRDDELSSITGVVITRNGTVIYDKPITEVGYTYTYKDVHAPYGACEYKIFCRNEYGDGLPGIIALTAGAGTGMAAENVTAKLTADKQNIQLSWQAPTLTSTGNPLDASQYKYSVYELSGEVLLRKIANLTSETSLTIPITYAHSDTARIIRYVIQSYNKRGFGVRTASESIYFGPTRTMPWTESFTLGNYEDVVGLDGNDAQWCIFRKNMSTVVADNDEGHVYSYNPTPTSTAISTPRIRISGTDPVARFWTCGSASEARPQIRVNDGRGWKTVSDTLTYIERGATTMSKPTLVEASLKDYIGKDVTISFAIMGREAKKLLFYDNLQVCQRADNNVGVTRITANARDMQSLYAGQRNRIHIKLRNFGLEKSDSGSMVIELSRPGYTVTDTLTGYFARAAGETFSFTDTIPARLGGTTVEYTARLIREGDGYDGDNVLKASYYVQPTLRPSVNLSGERQGHDAMLTWEAPSLEGIAGEPVYEDFSAYEHFVTTGIGDWTMIDADSANIFVPASYPHPWNEARTFFTLFDAIPGYSPKDADIWMAFSSHQCLSSPKAQSKKTDDWAILPELSGHAQKVHIRPWRGGSLQAWVSYTDKNLSSFVSLGNISREARLYLGDERIHYTEENYPLCCIDVPEGARWLAIRNIETSTTTTCTNFDDVTFIPAVPGGLVIQGYDVYRDGEKIASVDEPGYTDRDGNVRHTYHVVTRYASGESSPSASLTLEPSGIADTLAGGSVEVARYDVSGRQVDASYRGVVIIRYKDGTASRRLVR